MKPKTIDITLRSTDDLPLVNSVITHETDFNTICDIVAKTLRASKLTHTGKLAWDWQEAHKQGIKVIAIVNGNEPQIMFDIPANAKMLNGQEAIELGIFTGIGTGIQQSLEQMQRTYGGEFTARMGVVSMPRIYMDVRWTKHKIH